MKRQHLWIYAAAAVAILVGVAAFGSSGYVFAAVFLLLCPMMMMFMMGGMHGSGGHGLEGPASADHGTATTASGRDVDHSHSGGRSR